MKRQRKLVYSFLFLFGVALATEAQGGTSVGVSVRLRNRNPVVVTHYRYAFPLHGHHHGIHRHLVIAPGARYGTVDFNVSPKQSQVFIDGAYVGIADDFDGGVFGSTARLTPGTHMIRVVAPSGESVVRRVYVMPGKEINLNLKF